MKCSCGHKFDRGENTSDFKGWVSEHFADALMICPECGAEYLIGTIKEEDMVE